MGKVLVADVDADGETSGRAARAAPSFIFLTNWMGPADSFVARSGVRRLGSYSMCNKWRVAVAIAVRWFSPCYSYISQDSLNDYRFFVNNIETKFLSAPAGQGLLSFIFAPTNWRQQQWTTSTLQLENLIIHWPNNNARIAK